MLLDGQVAVVSGVGPGLGRSIAEALAAEGASIALGARNQDYLDELAGQLRSGGTTVVTQRTDITDPDACRAFAQRTNDELGRIDVLVNNGHQSRPQQLFDEAELDAWRPAMEVNYWGSLQMTQAAVPFLKERSDGRVILVNSMAVARVREHDGAYVGSKAALQSATRFLAADLGRFGIRVNGIHPGFMALEKLDVHLEGVAREQGTTADALRQEIAAGAALRYIPTADEVAGTVVYLASRLARPVTGQCLHVNAGHHFG